MDLTCQICSNSYTTNGLQRPYSLPCGHSFCGVCATRLLVNGEIMCPVCKQSYKYQDLDKITINYELEKVIERLASPLSLTESAATFSNPTTTPKDVTTPSSPKLHYGICEEHGTYKVHHCLTHNIFICSDCAVAYHLKADCHRLPIGNVLNDRKADLGKKIHSHMSSLQETGREVEKTRRQVELFDNILKDNELQIENQIEKLQSDLLALKQQMSICQNSASKYTHLISECEERQKQTQFSIDNAMSITTFLELNSETEWLESSQHKAQKWTKQVKDTLKECFGEILKSGTFASLVNSRETYATHKNEGQQRWGRIFSRDGYLLMQDFRNYKHPTNTIVINLSDLVKHLPYPRNVFLSFSTRGTHLGTVIIKVNEDAPMRTQQLIDLFVGDTGARYSGSTAIEVDGKGKQYERLVFTSYLTRNNEKSDEKRLPYLEKSGEITHKHGLVIMYGKDRADFRILTKSGYVGTYKGPAIGEVVSGLPVLEKIVEDNLVASLSSESKVTISESGLVIYSNNQK